MGFAGDTYNTAVYAASAWCGWSCLLPHSDRCRSAFVTPYGSVGEEGMTSAVAIDPDSNMASIQYQQIGMAKGAFIIGELTAARQLFAVEKQ